jgi:purine-nucleoside phosphorylase
MSTVPEAVVARLLGLEVAAISCISNLGTGLSQTPLTHAEVTEIAHQVSGTFRRLLTETVRRAFGRESA